MQYAAVSDLVDRHEERSAIADPRHPWWLWPNLLSLDAPVVAVAWHLLLVHSLHARLNIMTTVLLALVVWMIYAGDRMLDAWRGDGQTPRHEFARTHASSLVIALSASLMVAAVISLFDVPREVQLRGAVLAAGVLAYLKWQHGRAPAAKRLVESMLFASGIILPLPHLAGLGFDWIATVAVVWLNITAIHEWENGGEGVGLAALAIGALLLLPAGFDRFDAALAFGAFLTFGLNGVRSFATRDQLRVSADLALLLPALCLLLR